MKKIKIITFLFFITSLNYFSQKNNTNEDVSFLLIDKPPIFPECEGNIKELKLCFSNNIQKIFLKNFNPDLPNQLGLAGGEYRVFIGFKISNKGDIENILVKAPHEKIKKEVIRVMKLTPKLIPGEAKGKKVGVKYSIPFTMIVEESKSQRKERRKRERKARRNKQ